MTEVDARAFADEAQLQVWCDRIGQAGLRGTAGDAQERTIEWLVQELQQVPGFAIREESFEVLRWVPQPDNDLERAGRLTIEGGTDLPVAGAVPYSRPTEAAGDLAQLPAGEAITQANSAGKVLLRDFPDFPLPYDALFGLGSHLTADLDGLRGQIWDRPGFADGVLHDDLIAAGRAGAAGVVFAFDLPREQISGYFEPHKGTHYRLPAVFVGVEERDALRRAGSDGGRVTIAVTADVQPAETRNVYATLPGQSTERVVLVTHTDGNTWVQENGIAALLGLAHYFATLPLEQRHRTVELAFTSAHLHISKEGALRYARRLDDEYERGEIAFAFPIEHLGAREIVPVPDGDGRRLVFTGQDEVVLWAVGPSDPLQRAVVEAIDRRSLGRIVVAPGFGAPVEGQVPEIVSFGGLGTYFHQELVPTTSIITGPWSLWAPSFGRDAIDIRRLRQQALAAGDVVLALDDIPRDEIAGGYRAYRDARAAGAPIGRDYEPDEIAES